MKNIPLYKQIQHVIKHQITLGNLRSGDRIPSEKELAEQFHVSLITTKNAMAGLAEEGVVVRIKGKGTFVAGQASFKLRIPIETYQQTDESPEMLHIPFSSKPKEMIGIIIPSMRTKVEQRLLDSIENAVNENGYTLVIRVTRGSSVKELQAIEELCALGVRGLVLFSIGSEHERHTVDRASELGCPYVLIDRYYSDKPNVSVCSNNIEGAHKAVTNLVKQGFRQFALVTPPKEHSVVIERIAGFEQAVAKARLPQEDIICLTMPYEIFNEEIQNREQILDKWVSQYYGQFTALVAVDVELARLAHYSLIRTIGKERAKRIAIVTFDDPGIAGIAYVQQNEKMIGIQAVTLLLDQMHHGIRTPKKLFVPMEWIPSSS
ncbi:GntR family transcriptional regulator [Paenibacillus xylanilyticus]|uniref:GntR family transcriptional regulator n=1 Tax=Paenibacillus xylanilyticus TaxID=248903 RepID=A0A7Y6EWE6_9BACL|nr:GntR family transcriptional regulator [Paenibacillus xylanilyticus]NUU79237.1 GntR family transcriptional regulator [Paenibacillus xylanilyticus]